MGMSVHRIAAEIQAMKGLFRLLEGKPGIINAWEKLVGPSLISDKLAHDDHLAATMLVHGVTDILTFNIADFERFPGIIVLDPAQVKS
jgi:predicted nucleic acid-binding protein